VSTKPGQLHRESPALDIMRLLEGDEADIGYSDPYSPELRMNEFRLRSVEISPEDLGKSDLVVLVTDHTCFDYSMIQIWAPLIFDSRDAFREPSNNIVKL